MSPRIVTGLMLVAALAGGPALADEAKIRRILQSRMPTMNIESITRSPVAGLYELVIDGEFVYTDEDANYFFSGSVFDIRTSPPRNLTQERANQITAKTFLDARDLAIKRVRGNGGRTLFTFEDPNCGYCQALSRELAKMDDVTIYTFLLPLLSQDSVEKSAAVWCAQDRTAAWENLMARGVVPDNTRSCPNPLNRVAALAKRFQIQATPAGFLGDGRHIGGMRSALDIEKAFSAAAR